MLLIFGKDVRSGITKKVKRYAKANYKYMKDQYNPDEPNISSLFGRKQPLWMGNDPNATNTSVCMGKR